MLDCADRECIGLNVSQRNDAWEAAWALEDALIPRLGALPQGDAGVVLPPVEWRRRQAEISA